MVLVNLGDVIGSKGVGGCITDGEMLKSEHGILRKQGMGLCERIQTKSHFIPDIVGPAHVRGSSLPQDLLTVRHDLSRMVQDMQDQSAMPHIVQRPIIIGLSPSDY
jgi:hypothetical protein